MFQTPILLCSKIRYIHMYILLYFLMLIIIVVPNCYFFQFFLMYAIRILGVPRISTFTYFICVDYYNFDFETLHIRFLREVALDLYPMTAMVCLTCCPLITKYFSISLRNTHRPKLPRNDFPNTFAKV